MGWMSALEWRERWLVDEEGTRIDGEEARLDLPGCKYHQYAWIARVYSMSR